MPSKDLLLFYQTFVEMGFAEHRYDSGIHYYKSNTLGYPNAIVVDDNNDMEYKIRYIGNLAKTGLGNDQPQLLILGPEIDQNLAYPICNNNSYAFADYWEDMELRLSEPETEFNGLPATDSRIEVVRVADDRILTASLTLVNKVLFSSHPIEHNKIALSQFPENLVWFSSRIEGTVVSTLLLYIRETEKKAGVYMVCSDPIRQGKGFATNLMKVAINYALNKGCDKLVLQSTMQGKRLYKGLGFKTTGIYGLFSYRGEKNE